MTHTDQNQVQVLHVDDEPDFTDLSKTLLERDDDRFTVETTTSAEKGLSMIRECPPDCVVSDYNMPGMNGIEFLDVVREGYPDLPFILFTGKGSETVASDAISAGVTDYLQKEPGTDQYELLANRIRNAVEQVRMRKQLTLKERVVQEMNDIAVIVQDSIIKYTSPGISEFIGYAEDYPIDKPITEFIAPDYRETVQNRHQARMAGNESDLPNPYELELLTKDGERTPVEINVTRIEYEGQSATLSVIRDITERKHQKKRFQAFIEHSRDIITVLEPDGTYRYQSPSSKRVLGYAPDELLGEN
ncbi:MAG: PAS domain S-box protein, partial [Haloarcula sp.]